MNIVFIARSQFYRNTNTFVSNDFIKSLTKNEKYNIFLFWDDTDLNHVKGEIERLSPKLIILFEINNVSDTIKPYHHYIYSMGIPMFLFLEDTYCITSNTSKCQFTNLVNGLIFWYKSKSVVESYKRVFPNKYITNMHSRYVNTDRYKDYKLEKKYDILLYGTRNFQYPYKGEKLDSIQNYVQKYEEYTNAIITNNTRIDFYPLRRKMEDILKKLTNKYKIYILPETSILDPKISNIGNEELSILINQSYLCVACPGIADVMMHKFMEIAASKSVILGRYPSDYEELFKHNIIEVNEFMEEDEIIKIIDNALNNKDKLIEMSNHLYNKLHEEHNLNKACEDFTQVLDNILFT
jgi:hypothetical protein